MLSSTEILMEDETIVPVKATATGRIEEWYHRPGDEEMWGDIEENALLCTIDARYNGFPRLERVEAPVRGYLVEIIKDVGKLVTEGETIGRMQSTEHVVPPGILDRYDPSSIG